MFSQARLWCKEKRLVRPILDANEIYNKDDRGFFSFTIHKLNIEDKPSINIAVHIL
jgi:hypothetical protein